MSDTPVNDAQITKECPAIRRLRLWLQEKELLSDGELEHLTGCSRCQDMLLTLTEDPLLREMASQLNSIPISQYRAELELRRVQERLFALEDSSHLTDSPLSVEEISPYKEQTLNVAGETIDEPASVPSVQELMKRLPNSRFLVEELLAVGGSGAVYKAFDEKLSREVAIKVLSRNSMRDRHRFLREAKILAELEHPSIVRVFDVGVLKPAGEAGLSEVEAATTNQDTNGQLYLVLEYMAGGNARVLCELASEDELDQANFHKASDRFNEIARLVSNAADGLAFAHERGLVHRDIKPGNLLLNANRKQVKVADFGLARANHAEVSLVTKTGDLMGTPAFMSPEQIQNAEAISHSSDIYSLGATLYQMLTGSLPFQGNTATVLRQILESRPIAPRLIRPSIPVDLETICLRAMEYDPKDRYRSMLDFAEDLRRFNAGQPIKARPTSPLGHVIRYMRRNRGIASLLLACTFLLITITVGSLSAAIVMRAQKARLLASEANARNAKETAEQALRSSITAADDLLLAVTTETEYLPRTTGSQQVTRKLLEKARDYYRDFLSKNADNDVLKLQLARAHAGLAEIASRIGETEELERETLSALELISQISESDDNFTPVQRAVMMADARAVLANHFIEAGEAKKAIPLFEESIADLLVNSQERSGGYPDEDWLLTYATAQLGLANALSQMSRRDEALPFLMEAKQNFLNLMARRGEEPSLLRNAAACDITYATTAIGLQLPEKGRKHLIEADQLLAKIPEDSLISLRVREMRIRLLTNLALAERRLGNNREAKAQYQAVMDETKRLMELEPSVTSHQWNLVVASLNSGGPDMELGLHEDLLVRWRETIPVLQKLVAQDPGNQRYQQVQAMLQSNIAIILRDLGKWEEAIEPLESATEILVAQAQALDFASTAYLPVSLNYYELAKTYAKLDRLEDAERELVASDRVADDILLKDQAFVPARIQRLDNSLLRFEITKKIGSQDLEAWVNLSRPTLELARLLVDESPETLGLQRNLSIALLNEAEVLMMLSEYQQANSLIDESMGLLGDQSKLPSDAETEQDQVVERGLTLKREVESRLRDPD